MWATPIVSQARAGRHSAHPLKGDGQQELTDTYTQDPDVCVHRPTLARSRTETVGTQLKMRPTLYMRCMVEMHSAESSWTLRRLHDWWHTDGNPKSIAHPMTTNQNQQYFLKETCALLSHYWITAIQELNRSVLSAETITIIKLFCDMVPRYWP